MIETNNIERNSQGVYFQIGVFVAAVILMIIVELVEKKRNQERRDRLTNFEEKLNPRISEPTNSTNSSRN